MGAAPTVEQQARLSNRIRDEGGKLYSIDELRNLGITEDTYDRAKELGITDTKGNVAVEGGILYNDYYSLPDLVNTVERYGQNSLGDLLQEDLSQRGYQAGRQFTTSGIQSTVSRSSAESGVNLISGNVNPNVPAGTIVSGRLYSPDTGQLVFGRGAVQPKVAQIELTQKLGVTPEGGKTNVVSFFPYGNAVELSGGRMTGVNDIPIPVGSDIYGMIGVPERKGMSGAERTTKVGLTSDQLLGLNTFVDNYRTSPTGQKYTSIENYTPYVLSDPETESQKISRRNQRWYLENYGNERVGFYAPKTGEFRGYLGENAAPSYMYENYIFFPTGRGENYDKATQSSWVNTPDSERLFDLGFTDNVIYTGGAADQSALQRHAENIKSMTDGGTRNTLLTTGQAPVVDIFENIKRTPAEQKEFLANRPVINPKLQGVGSFGDTSVRFSDE